jgi:hypothetical protein
VVGNKDAATDPQYKEANGIYLDGGSHDIIVEGNTVSRVGTVGIFIQYLSYHNTIHNNIVSDCDLDTHGNFLYALQNTNYSCGQHVITHNVFNPKTAIQRLVILQEDEVSSSLHSPGVVDSNYYLNQYGNTIPFGTILNKPGGYSWNDYSFSGWKTATGLDAHSKHIVPASYERDTVFINSTAYPLTVNLPSVPFYDLDNNSVVGSFTLAPYSSKILIRQTATTPALTVNPTSLSFGNVIINTSSSEMTYTLTGSNLSPATDSLTITAPAGFTISTVSGSGYASSKRLAYTGGALSAKTIYVRFSPTAVQSYTGNIASAGGSATTKNVAVTGAGISAPTPTLSVNQTSLSFGNVIINTTSSEQTYTVQGSNLSPAVDSLTITAPAGFTISTVSGSGFASSKRIAYTGGALSAKTIYVRFSPTAVQSYTGNIASAGGSATTKNVAVTGAGISAPTPSLTVNPTSLSFEDVTINAISSERAYTLTGSNLSPASDSLTITAPAGFTISTVSGLGFASLKRIVYTGGALSVKIYVRFSPTAMQSYNGTITNAGGGATTQNVAVTGTGVSAPTPTLIVNPTSLSFGNIIINTISSERAYTLTGSNLSPASDSLTITVPSGFTISTISGSDFTSSKRIAYTGGALSAKTFYVRFSPTAVQSYTGTITNSGGSATTQNVAVTGTSVSAPTPTLTVNPSSLSFGNVIINTISSDLTYTLTGSNLSLVGDSLTITAPAGFTISTDSNSGFASSKSIVYTGGALSAKTIYVRFSPTALQSFTGNITNAGGGATTQNVAVTGTAISATTPALTVNPTSLSFGNVVINTISNELTYTLTGSNLSLASDSLTITAPPGFTISTVSGSGFTSSKRIAYTGGTLSAKTIYVRFSPTALQSYTDNITNTGGEAANQYVSITGTGINSTSPVIAINPGSLAFSTVRINTNSSEITYTVQGSYLSPASGNITITPPSGYQVSVTSGSGFGSSLNVSYTGSTLSSRTIYVRFYPTAVQSYTGNITNSGGGATTQNVAVSGTGVSSTSAALTVNPTSLSFGNVIINTTSSELHYTLTGLNLLPASDSLTITAPPGFTISTVSGSGFTSSKRIAYAGGTLRPIPIVIYVRFSPTAEQSYSDSITNGGGGAATKIVLVNGNGLLNLPPPTGTFIASSDTLPAYGGSVTLTWTSSNASSAFINNGIRTVAVNGSITRTIRSTTKFILTLSNINGNISYVKYIYVKPRKLSRNKALNMPSIASSVELTGEEANKANDGNTSTRWSSIDTDNQWWQVDLQNISTIENVTLTWDNSYASQFTISTSLDGLIFSDVVTGYASGPDTVELNFDPVDARYVRLTGIERGTQFGISFFELGVYESFTTSVKPTLEVPRGFSLEQNFPNPFNPSTEIGYQLNSTAEVQLIIYNVLGKEIATLVNQVQQAGHHSVTFNANNLASGVYYARLKAEGNLQTRKMMLMK